MTVVIIQLVTRVQVPRLPGTWPAPFHLLGLEDKSESASHQCSATNRAAVRNPPETGLLIPSVKWGYRKVGGLRLGHPC
jgi:hypothetical protein